MKRFGLIAASLLVFAAFLLWRAPAWLLTDRLGTALPELSLGQSRGTVWSGELDQLAYQHIQFDALQWQLRPLGLLSGLPLHIAMDAPAKVTAKVGVGTDAKVRLADVDVGGDIARLLGAAGLPSMGFDGRFSGALDEALLTPAACENLSGSLVLESLTGDVAGIEKVAPVAAELSCQAGAVVIQIDEGNAMRVRGNLQLRFGRAISGQVLLSPPPGSELYTSLSQLMGRPRNGKDFILRM